MNYIQRYFEGFKAVGMDTVYEIHRMRGTQKIEAHPFDHVTHDGVSALLAMARQFPEEGFKAPSLFVKLRPSMPKRLLELLKWYVRFYPFMPPKWKSFSKNKKEVVSAVIEVENWQSNDPDISVNTKLLYALDKTGQEYLTNSKATRVWMTPVGLYHGIKRDLEPANRVSFIDIKVKENATLKEIQDSSNSQLKELNYWGTMLTMALPIVLGKFIFANIVAKYTHLFFRRTGVFSNAGEWTIPGLAEDEWWVLGKGCVAEMSPVDGTAIIVNGRLGLSIHFHPYIGLSKEEAQVFVQKWKENYLAIV